MEVTICIGSACHLKNSRLVVAKMQDLVAKNGLINKVELTGSFCSENCENGVCVTVDKKLFSVCPETTEDFFYKEILGRL